ncbi:acid phosphatase [Vigna unguiculata]|uniref:Acid phosphatase n=1 Tax=Vigna unguiculata TaxID=3917 RepID=A0A4D6LLI4_VIGUN|nr:acid phosphatase [Vigna unguiculata]
MGDILDLDFVVSTGDNFYKSGIKGLNDPNFVQSFSNIYTAKSLRKQWYSVLGNHDYRGNALAQLSPILRRIDRRWFCQRSFILNAGVADFFFIDTTPFINKYFNTSSRHYDWRGVLPREKYIKNLLKDLEEALVKSSARWKIVVGHHAIRSIGHHGDSVELINHLVPLLKIVFVLLCVHLSHAASNALHRSLVCLIRTPKFEVVFGFIPSFTLIR